MSDSGAMAFPCFLESALWFQDDGPGQRSRRRENSQRGRVDAPILTHQLSPVLSVPPAHPAQALVASWLPVLARRQPTPCNKQPRD